VVEYIYLQILTYEFKLLNLSLISPI